MNHGKHGKHGKSESVLSLFSVAKAAVSDRDAAFAGPID
jgi:hypothetical protein